MTGLPVLHLDRIYWSPGWVETGAEAWEPRLAEEIAKPEWIIDGNYGRTVALRLARADTAILLDFSRWVCLRRMAQRVVLGWGRTRADMGVGCPERIDWDFCAISGAFAKLKDPD